MFVTFFLCISAIVIALYVISQMRYNNIFYSNLLKNTSALKYELIVSYFNSDLSILKVFAKSPLAAEFMENPNDKIIAKNFLGQFNNMNSVFSDRSMFFVSNEDRNFYYDTGYVYKIEDNPYWYDSTLYKTLDYNVNINYNPSLKSTKIWLNFPVLKNGKPLGMLGWGVDIDALAAYIGEDIDADNDFCVFYRNGEIMLHKNTNLVKEKRNVKSIISQNLIDELLELSKKNKSNPKSADNIIFRDKKAYTIKEIPFVPGYMIISTPTKIINGKGYNYIYIVSGVLAAILIFLICIYVFILKVINPLHNLNNLAYTLFSRLPIYIMVFDGAGKSKFISKYMDDLLGSHDASIDFNNNELPVTEENYDLINYIGEIRKRFGSFELVKEFGASGGKKSKFFKVVKTDVDTAEGSLDSLFYLQDVTDQMYLANADSLTGLANKRYFNERANQEFWNSSSKKKNLAFMLISVDNFRQFNDKYGHLAGEDVLKSIAKILSASLSDKNDFAGRIENEEFAIFLFDTDNDRAKIVAHRIRLEIERTEFLISCKNAQTDNNEEEQILAEPKTERVTVSIGVYSAIPNDSLSFKNFLDEAAKNLYNAKKFGMNRVC
ncbi:hypothetical protein AGMMS49938_15880 [Fibrobacterales bacterium]|nr:hypothetical protein AGMMS49938_15880 [Fibrobacterales bacterium]